ncbi:MAG: DUF1015 family protein [Candidatus Thermoplasmatota archaeon]|nr:DUF1015 family protein [Candidatus Thermoplasmatota archaeon]MCL5730594.1 DUF1015 family protein [Candidatus Thermoplasmatota archaeon]
MQVFPFKPFVFASSVENFHSPPFDTISPDLEQQLKKSEANITHLTLPENDDNSDAVEWLKKWKADGTIVRIDQDTVIILRQRFSVNGMEYGRIGFIALTSIYPPDGSIKPHERTFDGPKRRRMSLMSSLMCQPEPVFLLVSNQGMLQILRKYAEDHVPDREFEEPIGVLNEIFYVTDAAIIDQIVTSLKGDNAVVADGHHRLAATLELAGLSEGESRKFWSSTLSYICSVSDPGLLISGIHRCLSMKIDTQDLLSRLSGYFSVEEIESPESIDSILLYTGKFYRLSMLQDAIRSIINRDNESVYPALVLKEVIFKTVMQLDENVIEKEVTYTHSSEEAIRGVDSGRFSSAFLLPAWNKDAFIRLVMKGEMLTQKSTYFYPKPPSGIALNCKCDVN